MSAGVFQSLSWHKAKAHVAYRTCYRLTHDMHDTVIHMTMSPGREDWDWLTRPGEARGGSVMSVVCPMVNGGAEALNQMSFCELTGVQNRQQKHMHTHPRPITAH